MRTSQWFTTFPVLMGGALAWPTLALPHAGKRVMDNKTSATAFLLVASVFTACAGATKPDVPNTETQRKVGTDLEQCNVAAGNKGYGDAVTPEGNYSLQDLWRRKRQYHPDVYGEARGTRANAPILIRTTRSGAVPAAKVTVSVKHGVFIAPPVRSHPVPVALVGECSIPVAYPRVEVRYPGANG